MSENSFFANSSNVRIYGGQFNKIKGNITIFNQSRHTSTINSFNATTLIQENVNNNNSRRHSGGIENPLQDHRQRPAQQSRHPNAADYFPPLTVHPALATHLQSQEQLPPGSRTETRDSFNTTNKTMHNVGNDNSSRYEGPYTKRKRRSRRQKATYNDDPEDTMDDLSSFSPPAFPHVSVSSSMPAYFTAAQNVDGTPEVAFDVEGEEGEMDESDNLGSSFEYEEPPGNEVNAPKIADGMASLTLNDTLRPAISRVKSAPPLEDASSGTSNHRPPISNPNPRLSESTQELPAHIQYPFKCADPALPRLPFQSSSPHTAPDGHARPDLNPSTSKPERQTPGPASPSSGAQSVPEAFGIKPSFIKPHPSGGNIVFNDINGDYSKTDQSVHNTFLNSGNTANTLVLDSYNDNSVRITRLL